MQKILRLIARLIVAIHECTHVRHCKDNAPINMYYVAPETPMTSSVIADCPDLVPPKYFGQVYAYALHHLDAFLMQMRKHGVTLNLKNCIFAKPKAKFIGHIVGLGTIEINPERTESLLNMKIPETKKQVKQILGFFSYYRQCVNNFGHDYC